MKKFFLFAVFCFYFSTRTLAVPVFFGWGAETAQKVASFPSYPLFSTSDTRSHFDAGFRYKQITIFFIPVWNYDAEWCGYISDKQFVNLSRSELEAYAERAGVKLPEEFPFTFWQKIGGKLLLGGLLLGWLWYVRNNSSNEQS